MSYNAEEAKSITVSVFSINGVHGFKVAHPGERPDPGVYLAVIAAIRISLRIRLRAVLPPEKQTLEIAYDYRMMTEAYNELEGMYEDYQGYAVENHYYGKREHDSGCVVDIQYLRRETVLSAEEFLELGADLCDHNTRLFLEFFHAVKRDAVRAMALKQWEEKEWKGQLHFSEIRYPELFGVDVVRVTVGHSRVIKCGSVRNAVVDLVKEAVLQRKSHAVLEHQRQRDRGAVRIEEIRKDLRDYDTILDSLVELPVHHVFSTESGDYFIPGAEDKLVAAGEILEERSRNNLRDRIYSKFLTLQAKP